MDVPEIRDSDDNDKIKLMPLDAFEFIRRFLLHILPDQFKKIRHYGILSNRNRTTKLLTCKEILGVSTNQNHEVEKPTWEELPYSYNRD